MSIVYIVGAGPGDPGLMTVRGRECLRAADVVLYDRSIPPQLLRDARPGAERIEVGAAAPEAIEQEAICYLLAEKAREGKVVARLKWGDPFVFDRGGSEALFLHEQGIRFEVVPGVLAAVGASAFAGIPLTYPGAGDALVMLRGHEDGGHSRRDVDWPALARIDGTLVTYAGPDDVTQILTSLMLHGRGPDEPAALIYDGTLGTQRTLAGSLRDLSEAATVSSERRPAILVVGRVAALREHLRWFDARPLFGLRVLVTRPREQAAELVALLESAGAQTLVAPMIRILPPDDYRPLDQACADITGYDWVVFSSRNAVEPFVTRLLASPHDLRALHGVRLCAVGPATAEQLAACGLKVDLIPAEHKAEGVVRAIFSAGAVGGQRVLLPRSDIGREVIADDLRKQGAQVTEVVAYRTVTADADRDPGLDVYRLLLERQIDIVTFTSASAVRAFVQLLGAEPAADLLRDLAVAAIGPVTAEAATQWKIQTTIMPSDYTIPAMVDEIVRHAGSIRAGQARLTRAETE